MSTVNLREVSVQQRMDAFKKENPDTMQLLSLYPEEMGNQLIDSKEIVQKISKMFNNISSVSAINASVMTCSSECIYKDVCILLKNNIAPIGHSCPVEKKIILEMESEIVRNLEIDRNNYVEMEMLWDLIETKILDMRSSGALKNGKLTQTIEQKIGPNVLTRIEISPEIEIKLELKKLKHSIIDSFIATRRAKKKYGMNTGDKPLERLLLEAAARNETD